MFMRDVYLWIMEKVDDGPFKNSGGGLHTSSKNVSDCHEDVVITQAHRLVSDLCCVVVLSAALGSEQSVQQVPLHVVAVVYLMDYQCGWNHVSLDTV